MLLTLKPSQQHGYANPYAYSPAQRSPSSYYSSPSKPVSLPSLPDSKSDSMSTPHRGLPPPSVMERSLPLPDRAPPTSGVAGLSLAPLPSAPPQWQGHDESMRTWLRAKSEEDKRRQEEERTRQEGLKLEQRKVEQNILQESLRGGVPPALVPMVFAGIGGGNIAQMSVDWGQQYMALQVQQQQQQQQAQIQQQQQQQQQQQAAQPQLQASPEQRRDTRLLTGPNPNPYGAQQMQPPAQSAPAQSVQQNANFTTAYQAAALQSERLRPQLQAAPPTSNPRPTTSQLSMSRLNTGGDIHQPAPASSTLHTSGQHPLQQAQAIQQPEQPSSPLYFHHWQPPDAQSKSKDKEQNTPAGRNSQHTSPNNPQPPGSHLRGEYTTSPKKRKATGSHQAAPTPTSHTSPSFSQQGSSGSTSGTGRRRRHSRASDTSSQSHSRPAHESDRQSGRQSFSEADSGRNSAHAETRHAPVHHSAGSDGREMREIRQVSRDLSERNSPKRES